VHAGDWTHGGSFPEIAEFAKWFRGLTQARYKVCIPGNHDVLAQTLPEVVQDEFQQHNVHLLNGTACVIEDFKFYGDPHTPRFGEGFAFQLDRGTRATEDHWAKIPLDTKVLITHGPPYGFRDRVVDHTVPGNRQASRFKKVFCNVGCRQLLDRIRQVRPTYHICGHIHGGYGIQPTGYDTIVVNAAQAGDSLGVAHMIPLVVHL
jgi:Icc-related predicted phosphoesterase